MVLNEIYTNYFQHLKVLQAWMGEMCNIMQFYPCFVRNHLYIMIHFSVQQEQCSPAVDCTHCIPLIYSVCV